MFSFIRSLFSFLFAPNDSNFSFHKNGEGRCDFKKTYRETARKSNLGKR